MRTLATVRVTLSVAVSTIIATPCGAVAFVEDDVVARCSSWPLARLMADVDLVLRHVGGARVLEHAAQRRVRSALGPPALTAIAISLASRVNSFAILFQRANIVCLRVSKMRPMRKFYRTTRPSL